MPLLPFTTAVLEDWIPDSSTGLNSLSNELFDNVLRDLSTRDLVRLAKTNKRYEDLAVDFCRRSYDVTKVLSKHFTDQELRRLQWLLKVTGAIISGSTALQLFERMDYEGSDCDIYVEDKAAAPWLLWLSFRYRRTSINTEGPPEQYRGNAICAVHTFVRAIADGRPSTVQIITTHNSPLEGVFGFGLSCVMNFITHESAYSLSPYLTSQHRTLVTNIIHDPNIPLYQKYLRRKFKFLAPPDDLCAHRETRYIGDKKTFKVNKIWSRVSALGGSAVSLFDFINTFDVVDGNPTLLDYEALKPAELEVPYTMANNNGVRETVNKALRENKCGLGVQEALKEFFENGDV
ncbi:hypothetical protein BDN72DRAFT_878138 [Pluteus cervinus]|uniref:Uncharacterized protein n=1 Tax=Pluteus cervinus TaxID=181527 RepID=A0ACD3AWK6_9AGAR|nr:hypothetical protein BDN72DRAFT_878138 [Pluteus cervinus]